MTKTIVQKGIIPPPKRPFIWGGKLRCKHCDTEFIVDDGTPKVSYTDHKLQEVSEGRFRVERIPVPREGYWPMLISFGYSPAYGTMCPVCEREVMFVQRRVGPLWNRRWETH